MLALEQVEVTIQSAPILRGLSLSAAEGELVGLVGRNGAGKTTTMRTIMGLAKLRAGRVLIEGEDVTGLSAHRRNTLGLGYMPEDRRLVPQLTVDENMELPAWVNPGIDRTATLAFIHELMPELAAMRDRKAMLLSGGQQKMVALGRALMAGTKLLLLDEPFEGVAPALALRLSEVIAALRQERRSVLIAQSELTHSTAFLDRQYVIERGAIIREETGADVAAAG
ncbi:MAG: ATP-binding cassette domain-containing protein [Alphaproteobacteria bacterium]|nr:ATP-binding cassette domain-containing protein [Alphaproteobacteria bacterium]